MRRAVENVFFSFTEEYEGFTLWFYLDKEGLVTVGYGNLADPIRYLGALSFFRKDGSKATDSEVQAYWLAVKVRQDLKGKGGGHAEFRALADRFGLATTLREIERLCVAKLRAADGALAQLFPCWDSWPANAQLACLSMVWALGAAKFAREFPKFQAACLAHDWALAATECHMNETGQPREFRARNVANRMLLESAGATDPEAVSWVL